MLEFPPFRLDVAEQRLWRDDRAIELRPKTFDVLQYLVERPGKLVRHESLLEAIWSDAAVTPGNLNNSIHELRKALGDDARQPTFIETVHRRGFRFLATVHCRVHSQERDETQATAPEPESPATTVPSPKQPERRGDFTESVERLLSETDSAWRDGDLRESARRARRVVDLLVEVTSDRKSDGRTRGVALELGRSALALSVTSSHRELLSRRCLDLGRELAGRLSTNTVPPNRVREAIDRLSDVHKSALLAHERSEPKAAAELLEGLARLGDELDEPQT